MLKIDPAQLATVELKDILQYLIEKHNVTHTSRLQDYYEGRHDILTRQMLDTTKPNNQIVNNLAAYITDTLTGYFMGKPVSYSADEISYLDAIIEICDYNDESDHNAELAKSQSIKGCAFELLYTDEDAMIRFAELPRENVIYVETDDVAAEPALAVRIYEVDDIKSGTRYFYDIYTDTEIITYEETTKEQIKSLVERGKREHYFQGVPVIAYPNNKELLGDFEGVMTQIDAYNIAQSDTANDFEYFTDAYLKLVGMTMDSETVAKMKENRVIGLPDKDCSADWLIKQINDVATENYKARLRKDIHSLAKTPNLSDEEFAGNLSGVALQFKILGMEWVAATKERKFKRALQRRIELITNILNTSGRNWDWRDIDITFSRNLPMNVVEQAKMVADLKGTVSDLTLLSLLPFVEDAQDELDRLREESEGKIDLDAFNTPEEVDIAEEDAELEQE